MLVHNWMTQEVVTISPEETVLRAQELMEEREIRRLPVVHEGKLVGIITRGDIQRVLPSTSEATGDLWELDYLHPLAKLTVAEAMTEDPLTISPGGTIEEAALLMQEHKIGGLPVVEEGELVGIITESDIFRAMIEVMGLGWGGMRIDLEVEDRPGALLEVLEPIKRHGANIISIVTCRESCTGAHTREVVLRVEAPEDDTDKIIAELKEQGVKVLDVRRSDREPPSSPRAAK